MKTRTYLNPVRLAILASLVCTCTVPGAAYANTSTQPEETVQVVLDDRGMYPSVIVSKENRPIHLHIVNQGHELHQFSIPDFYIFTRTLYPGEASDVEFSPYKLGKFTMSSDAVAENSSEYVGKFNVRQ